MISEMCHEGSEPDITCLTVEYSLRLPSVAFLVYVALAKLTAQGGSR